MNAYILLKISGDRLPEENVKYAPVLQYIKRKDFDLTCLSICNK